MFTVRKMKALVVSDLERNSWPFLKPKTGRDSKNELPENVVDTQIALTDAEVQRLMNPIITGFATRTTIKDNPSTILQIGMMNQNMRFILDEAAHVFIGKTNRNVLDILKGAYWPNISGWSIVEGDIVVLSEFTKSVLKKLQSSKWMSIKSVSPANELEIHQAA